MHQNVLVCSIIRGLCYQHSINRNCKSKGTVLFKTLKQFIITEIIHVHSV